jgi:hypothetical protein
MGEQRPSKGYLVVQPGWMKFFPTRAGAENQAASLNQKGQTCYLVFAEEFNPAGPRDEPTAPWSPTPGDRG